MTMPSNVRQYTLKNMISRCYNPQDKKYALYGGKGISVCEEWRQSPASFAIWSENNGWGWKKHLHRVNSKAGYYPENCIWLTQKEHYAAHLLSIPRGEQHWMKRRPERILRGIKHWNSRFTDTDVALIRLLYKSKSGGLTQQKIAAIYGVGQMTISDIITGRTWPHLITGGVK